MSSSDVLYSKRIFEIASIYLIDGEIVKCRGLDKQNVTLKIVSDAIVNFNDIVIQYGKQIAIFASDKTVSHYKELLNEDRLKRFVENGNIVLNYKI